MNFLTKAITAAAVAFSGMTLIYGDAEYAAVGPVSVQTDMLMKIVPVLAAVVWPVLSKKWPVIASTLSLALRMIQYRNPEIANLLSNVDSLTVHAKSNGDDAMAKNCEEIRAKLIERVQK